MIGLATAGAASRGTARALRIGFAPTDQSGEPPRWQKVLVLQAVPSSLLDPEHINTASCSMLSGGWGKTNLRPAAVLLRNGIKEAQLGRSFSPNTGDRTVNR
eukprot:1011930-Pleurochrysis_carterae.AAC.1